MKYWRPSWILKNAKRWKLKNAPKVWSTWSKVPKTSKKCLHFRKVSVPLLWCPDNSVSYVEYMHISYWLYSLTDINSLMQFHIWFVDMIINIFYYLEYYNKCPKIIWRHVFVLLATALYSHTFKRGITLLKFTQLFQILTGYLKLLWAIYFILWLVYKYLLLDSYNHTKSSFIRTCLVFYALNTCMYYMSDFSVLRRYTRL